MTGDDRHAPWPGWVARRGWLSTVLAVAEEEARERGDARAAGHHLALALTRDEQAGALLHQLGVEPRRWRDHLNFVLGVNAGRRSEREQRQRTAAHRSPAEIYQHGPLSAEPDVVAVLHAARADADRADQPVAAAHLLAALADGRGGIGTGTAWWLGLAATAVRQAAGLPDPTPATPLPDPQALSRPTAAPPMVLCGGGSLPAAALAAITDIAGRSPRGRTLRMAYIGAASGDTEAAARRCAELRHAVPDADVVDAGLTAPDTTHDPRAVEALSGADAVFLDGGDPERLYHALTSGPALSQLVAAADRGAVLVGYSAGAQILGIGCQRGSWAEPRQVNLLGWLADFVVLPHCSGTGMLAHLRDSLSEYPGAKGLGISHHGAVLIPPGFARIENLTTGLDDGSIVLTEPDEAPHRLCDQPYTLTH